MTSYKIRYPDELYHHGIKGQKWGVRRFQNEDETLLNDLIFGIEHDKDWYREIPDLEKLLGK